MKNKKIIILTAFVIVVTVFGVIGMSKLMESAWQKPEDKDNKLTVNENNLQVEESVFDYPYINIKDHKLITDNSVLERYAPAIKQYDMDISLENRESLQMIFDENPLDEMVSYQYIANVGGEVAKYLYGITEHQSFPALIYYLQDKNPDVYYKEYYKYYLITNNHSVIDIIIEPYTGKILAINAGQFLVVKPDYENIVADISTDYLSDDVKATLIAQVKENLDIIGNFSEIDKMKIVDNHALDGYNSFQVYISHADDTQSFLTYITVDFDYFELESYNTWEL